MGAQKHFTKEFKAESVRLALASGKMRRSVAADLGVGLSTLSCWIREDQERRSGSSRETEQPYLAAELKRLRGENENLCQERDILKRATAFSSGTEVDEVHAHRSGERRIPHTVSV